MTDSKMSEIRIWIVSAWLPEQSLLIGKLSRGRNLEKFSSNLQVCGPYAFLTTGVGTPRAALALGSALTSASAAGAVSKAVYFVATAGAYRPDFGLNSAHAVSSALWTDSAIATGLAYLPKSDRFEHLNSSGIGGVRAAESSVRAVSTPGITLDHAAANRFSGFAELENLEIYGVALAALSHNIPWNGVLGVSNLVGSAAHEEWKLNHETASAAAQNKLQELFAEDLSQ